MLSINGSINGNDLKVPLVGRGEDEEAGVGRSTAVPAAASKHSLGFGALVFLIYYNIGVPFGDEEVGGWVPGSKLQQHHGALGLRGEAQEHRRVQ